MRPTPASRALAATALALSRKQTAVPVPATAPPPAPPRPFTRPTPRPEPPRVSVDLSPIQDELEQLGRDLGVRLSLLEAATGNIKARLSQVEQQAKVPPKPALDALERTEQALAAVQDVRDVVARIEGALGPLDRRLVDLDAALIDRTANAKDQALAAGDARLNALRGELGQTLGALRAELATTEIRQLSETAVALAERAVREAGQALDRPQPDAVLAGEMNGDDLVEVRATGRRTIGTIKRPIVQLGGGGRSSSSPTPERLVGKIVETSTDYTVRLHDELILVDATAGDRTVTVPDARVTPRRIITIKKMNTTGGNVLIVPARSGDTIDEDTDATLTGACRPAARLVTITGGYVIAGTGLP